ncbi:MAG TPA: diguanylate cyclase [Thiobacillaceae bacterium]|nr:diguanylate cyclase [Thiobacillaceae bacterium]HNU65406.1 diguanylate cyclase [Thiobacillaceae bacterium]
MVAMHASPAALILVLSVLLQLIAAGVALGQMRHAGRYRYAWLAISAALALMVPRRVLPLLDLLQGHAGHDTSALLGLLISGLMLVGVLGLRALFTNMRRQERELVHLATIDGLTHASNRRHALQLARAELVRQRRTGRPLAVLILDLDHFKKINDGYGHAVGDAVLAAVAAACMAGLRGMDVFGRLGGEEFVIVLPETDAAQALASAERLRTRVAALEVAAGDHVARVTVSIGVALGTGRQTDPDSALAELLRRADTALYAAKAAGRDRSVVWHAGLSPRS